MQHRLELGIEIPLDGTFKHLKDKSFYDHNYYHINEYGDWFYGECNTIRQEYDECSNCYSYSLGYFEKDKSDGNKEVFKGVIYWTKQEDIFEGIE